MTMRKYKREEAAKDDKQQSKLDFKSEDGIKVKQPEVTVSVTARFTGQYCCPFCLHKDKIEAYLISRKKGYDKRLGHCPECNNNMEIKTLTSEMTPEEYAQFLFDYSRQGGWQKVKFNVWKERMKAIGWSERFWNKYRQLKGEGGPESYTDYIQRKQYEAAQEMGWIEK